jgi:hypothetical protein
MQGIGDGLEALFKMMVVLIIVFVPLGMWKLVEIVIWAWANIHFGEQPVVK